MQATEATSDVARELPFALMRVARRIKEVPARSGDDAWAVHLLYRIREQGGCRVSELATAAGLDVSTVSRHVARLEAAGHVVRRADPEDRRAARLDVTDAGRDLLCAAAAARARIIDAALAGWAEEDRTTLVRLADRLADDLDRAAEHRPDSLASE